MKPTQIMPAGDAFESRDANETTSFQNSLLLRGTAGQIAFGLFRAQKRSTRAKNYKRALRRESYAAKGEALKYLDMALSLWGHRHGISWGWKLDPRQAFHNQVLYVDLPGLGQCSFHAEQAASAKRYSGHWDSRFSSQEVVLGFCDSLAAVPIGSGLGPDDLMPFGKHVGKPLGAIGDHFWEWLAQWDGINSWPCLHQYAQERGGVRSF